VIEESMSPAEMVKAVNDILGKPVMKLGNDESLQTSIIPTSVLSFDYLLGGGLPVGRWTEVYGEYSTLKSYLALKACATAQSLGLSVAYIDTERTFDASWATALGVDTAALMYPPDIETGEEAVDAIEAAIRSGMHLVVWDSIAATLPEAEHGKSAQGSKQQARQAAMMSAATRKLTASNHNSCAILAINQTRENVGMTFGPTIRTPGGKSLPFYASHRISMNRAGKVRRSTKKWDGEKMVPVQETVAFKIRAVLEKSKLTSPYAESYLWFDLATGEVDDTRFAMGLGLESGVVKERGQSFEFDGTSKRGREAFISWIGQDGNAREALYDAVFPGLYRPDKSKVVSGKRKKPRLKV